MARRSRASAGSDTGVLLTCLVLSGLALVAPPRLRTPVVDGLQRTAVAPLLWLQGQSHALRAALLARDGELRGRGAVIAQAQQLPAVDQENVRLRQLLGLGGRLRWGFVTADVLASRGPGDDFTLTLTAGSSAGVMPYTPVVAADGLVGIVQSVQPQSAVAISWAHPDFRVSAMSADESTFGIVQPHVDRDDQRFLLELRGVPFRASLAPGTVIVSSGLGATYPRGIPVGVVLSEVQTSEQWARTYLLRPAVSPTAIGPVLLLLPPRVVEGVDTIWTTLGRADSAARAIAQAGDSMVRGTALAELAARRAAMDSTRLDSLRRAGALPDSVPRDSTVRPAAPPRPTGVLPNDSGAGARRRRAVPDSTPARPPR
jgi:rod shape-determining protein MreC